MPSLGLLGGADFDYDQALKMLDVAAQGETQRNIANQQIAAQNRAAKGKLATTAAAPFVGLALKSGLPKAEAAIKGLTSSSTATPPTGDAIKQLGSSVGDATPAASAGLAAPTADALKGSAPGLGASVAPQTLTPVATEGAKTAGEEAGKDLATDAATNTVADAATSSGGSPIGLVASGADEVAKVAGLKGNALKAVDVGSQAVSGATTGAAIGAPFGGVGGVVGGAAGAVAGAVLGALGQ